MEEVLAENRFVITKDEFVEGRLALSRDNFNAAAKKLGLVMLILLAALIGASVLLGMGPFSVAMELLILGFMALWLLVLFPRSSAKTAYKALVKKAGAEPERTTRFYEDHLEIEGPGVHAVLSYEQIVQIRRTKRLLILFTDEKGGVLLRPEAFTKGDEALVRQLIDAGKEPNLLPEDT